MTKTEELLETLETCKICYAGKRHYADFTLNAKLTKQFATVMSELDQIAEIVREQSDGCEYCKQVIVSVKMNFETDSILGENKWFSSTRHPKFCPMCGRRLTERKEEGEG